MFFITYTIFIQSVELFSFVSLNINLFAPLDIFTLQVMHLQTNYISRESGKY
jgi:hypothetical protein